MATSKKNRSAVRYWALFLLLIAYILSFIDRNIMAILVDPIRQDFHISDFGYGLLNGVAFTFFYAFLGLPIGYLADRRSRTRIIGVGTAIWSVMTFTCGMASGFVGLFAARVGVGIGEAALSPPAHSLLSDYFSKRQLPVVMAIFTLGIPVGIGVSFSLGGYIYGYFDAMGGAALPFLGDLKPWQLTFMMVGAPGLLLAGLIYMLKEPARTGVMETRAELGVNEALDFFRQHKRVYFFVFAAISALSIVGYSLMMWYVAHMSRVYDLPAFEISKTFGLIYLFFGSLGTLGGAWLSGFLGRKGYKDAGIRVLLIVAVLWVVPGILAPQMPTLTSAFIMAAPCTFFLNAFFGVSIAAVQVVTPNQLRAQASAVLLLMANIAGLAIGPAIVGLLSDDVFSGVHSLGNALSLVAAIFSPLAIALVMFALKPYRQLLEASEQWSLTNDD
ncbi:putative L-galactonate transporter [BD1-7 clade bacterium]|uniref:Putative L-galactonate transporter n=1 Tax=BD1-7 clade bacterium TaxID=2029982 RepID=A0A5S9NLV0_9GAMM|nr:putative L-galactonate transporter [BD1-7 clade bacterium]CAA0093964.1 putative L-galactonate transporter [BD1-7 clade bacterium]